MTTPTDMTDTGLFPDPTPATAPLPIDYEPELATPRTSALLRTVQWVEDAAAVPRWVGPGVQVRNRSHGTAASAGVWPDDPCDPTPTGRKVGVRPTSLDPFGAVTVWAADECDMTPASRAEVSNRAPHVLAMREPTLIEAEFAARLLADAGQPAKRAGVAAAIGYLESKLAQASTYGVVHVSPEHVGACDDAAIIQRTGALRTPLESLWCFAGGYADVLGRVLVATTPVLGWRSDIAQFDAVDPADGTALSIAERSTVLGYEAVIAAVELV